jgi:hypothetical protein
VQLLVVPTQSLSAIAAVAPKSANVKHRIKNLKWRIVNFFLGASSNPTVPASAKILTGHQRNSISIRNSVKPDNFCKGCNRLQLWRQYKRSVIN